MQTCTFTEKGAAPVGQLSVGQAFRAQGVTLRYPMRSRSGVRSEDGAVVIALERSEIQASADGYRCRLWSPTWETCTAGVNWPSMKERLEHCRLAARHGGADGLLIEQGAMVEADVVLTMHVEHRGVEYWASWGTAARSQRGARLGSSDPQAAYAAAAA